VIKFNYILKVIVSCKTHEQLDAASFWLEKLELDNTDYLDLKETIAEQRFYLNKLNRIEAQNVLLSN
jgi:hypothetical protein